MSYVLLAWIATIMYGLETVIIKLSGKYAIKNPWLFNALWNVLFTVFMIPIFTSHPVALPKIWGNLLITSFLSAVCCILYIISTYRLDVSTISPLYNVRTGLAVLFAALLLGEKMTSHQLSLVGIIIVMGFIVTVDEKFSLQSFFRKDIIIALIYMALLALYVVYAKKTILDIGYWSATIWQTILIPIMLIPTFPKFSKEIKSITRKQMIPIILVSVTSTVGYLLANKAIETNVGITSVIMTFPLPMILAFIISLIWPKLMEKHPLKIYAIRFAATAIMFMCALGLG